MIQIYLLLFNNQTSLIEIHLRSDYINDDENYLVEGLVCRVVSKNVRPTGLNANENDNRLRSAKFELRRSKYELRSSRFEVRSANYEVRRFEFLSPASI